MENLLSIGFVKGSFLVVLCIAIIYVLVALFKILFGKDSSELLKVEEFNDTEEKEEYQFSNIKEKNIEKQKEPLSKRILRFLVEDTPLQMKNNRKD